ncbi:MAG TPA: FAD-dependent oxidoreductase [Solirubrobacter sp.]|nr:FAD-dependent oxidoreductase [Solirubrobacter sp.]
MRVAVIGAGVGGLTAAVELAAAGHRVTVFERGAAPGGKCARVDRNGFAWDAGPSLLTMPWVFRDLELELLRVEPVTRYEFADGTSVELSADLPRALEALEAWSPGSGADWARFLGTCAGMWRASERFLTGPPPWPPRRPEPGEPLPDPRDALRVKPWWTLRQLARAHARDPRLQMIVERFATYAGGDPRRSPAALAVAGYVEHAFGAWHPRGGMYEIVRALVRRLKGDLRLNEPVERILVTNGRVRGVATANGSFPADAVVAAIDEADVRPLAGLPPRRREPSLGGQVLLLGVRDTPDVHHRILFPSNYDAEFDDIFVHRRMPRDPTLYVSAPSVTDPSEAPGAWFVLVNAPAAEAEFDDDAVIERLNVDVVHRERVRYGPIYGPAPHGRLSSLRRPGNRVRGVKGLWLAGGTVHPGGGLPLVALGGRSVARQIGPA